MKSFVDQHGDPIFCALGNSQPMETDELIANVIRASQIEHLTLSLLNTLAANIVKKIMPK